MNNFLLKINIILILNYSLLFYLLFFFELSIGIIKILYLILIYIIRNKSD